jgi:sporulation protein YlmC with PRC-barrel domain
MLRSLKDLGRYALAASDGSIGQVKDCYFKDPTWAIHYLVVDVGNWPLSRPVLIAPDGIGRPSWNSKRLPVSITTQQVRNSPNAYPGMMLSTVSYDGADGNCSETNEKLAAARPVNARPRNDGPGLRSCKDVLTYRIQASDGQIGHISDVLVDENTWVIRYLMVKINTWRFGHQVLIPPVAVTGVSWSSASVSVDMNRQAVKNLPVYDFATQLKSQYET